MTSRLLNTVALTRRLCKTNDITSQLGEWLLRRVYCFTSTEMFHHGLGNLLLGTVLAGTLLDYKATDVSIAIINRIGHLSGPQDRLMVV